MSEELTQTATGADVGLSELVSTDATGDRTITLDSSKEAGDVTAKEKTYSEEQWKRLNDQRDLMIGAMIKVFTWLNGGVYGLVIIAFVTGLYWDDYRIVDNKTLMTLIGATVVQAGLAFAAITRFLFPNASDKDKGPSA